MKFGVHVSIAQSLIKAITRAKNLNCDVFQIFTRNPRSWKAKDLDFNTTKLFKAKLYESKIFPIYSHMPYLTNLSSSDDLIWNKSIETLKLEIKRCDSLDIPYIVTHLGSTKGSGTEFGINRFVSAIEICYNNYQGNCSLLLENSTSKKQSFGSSLTDIREIISRSKKKNLLGICFDTCHAFASGYDIRKSEVIDEILNDIHLNKLKLIHCNDSKFEFGSGRDRHEHIGLGKIGLEGFRILVNNEKLSNVPFICETPIDERRDDIGNLNLLKSLKKN